MSERNSPAVNSETSSPSMGEDLSGLRELNSIEVGGIKAALFWKESTKELVATAHNTLTGKKVELKVLASEVDADNFFNSAITEARELLTEEPQPIGEESQVLEQPSSDETREDLEKRFTDLREELEKIKPGRMDTAQRRMTVLKAIDDLLLRVVELGHVSPQSLPQQEYKASFSRGTRKS
jgi:tellurite resistance-related uncharacterized protein